MSAEMLVNEVRGFDNAFRLGILAVDVAGSGDYTLSSAEKVYPHLKLTGILTAARNLIVPLTAGSLYVVDNQTTGLFALTVKGATGTGVVVQQGEIALLKADGTNVTRITPGAAGDGVVQWAEVSLTNAQVLALRATPITLVAAPGAGRVLEFLSAVLIFDYTAAYTETADNLGVKYENGSGVQVSQDIETTGFLDATADTLTRAIPKVDAIAAKTGCENKALVLHNIGGDEFGGGDAGNAVRVKVAYRVMRTGW